MEGPWRVQTVRKLGGITFLKCFPWVFLGSSSTVEESYEFLLQRTDKGYLENIKKLHPGAIVYGKVGEKDSKGRRSLEITRIQNPSRFPSTFPKNPITDKEIRYNEPILDIFSNRRRLKLLVDRSRIQRKVSQILHKKGFLRVTTPVLETQPGGGDSEPFETFSNYNGKKYYLRSCHEFPGKKLLIKGLDKVYIQGPIFRNEDLGKVHIFEFEGLQGYYLIQKEEGFNSLVRLVQEIYTACYKEIHGNTKLGEQNLEAPWPVVEWKDLTSDLSPESLRTIQAKLKKNPQEFKLPPAYHLSKPPSESCPLAANEGRVALSFQTLIKGVEITTCYVQQNDSKALTVKGGSDKGWINCDFLKSLDYGLPPAAGFGIGIDRLAYTILREGNALVSNIRDIQAFPTL